MATVAKAVSGATVTYTITDQAGSTLAITATAPASGNGLIAADGLGSWTFSGSGAATSLLNDGCELLATLLQQWITGLQT